MTENQFDLLNAVGAQRCHFCREWYVPMTNERSCPACLKFEYASSAVGEDIVQSPFTRRATTGSLPANAVVGNRSL